MEKKSKWKKYKMRNKNKDIQKYKIEKKIFRFTDPQFDCSPNWKLKEKKPTSSFVEAISPKYF